MNSGRSNEGIDVSEVQNGLRDASRHSLQPRSAGALIVFIRNVYSTNAGPTLASQNKPANMYRSDSWLELATCTRKGSYTRRQVCAEGSLEGDFYGDIRLLPSGLIATKHHYSGFHNTDLNSILRSHGIRTVILTGIATNVQRARDLSAITTSYLSPTEQRLILPRTTTTEDDKATLTNIDRFFSQVTTIGNIISIWKG